ncbi:metallophosphoesterase [Luteolibacter sp. SL250]|uniref:LamG-like jellyroll fold domain-containing protein n=1 Tax=Luteolibacter sp. SL250 TaxID=2995170 RepID=UPI002270400A|nr:LamG-like jellyroll fold domain-containing protein [Luteolibacter sp. SL250]WAC21192.1 metallophosphoesterase [Luteolibacter sp. SL250]
MRPFIPAFTCLLLLAAANGVSAQIHTDRPAPLALPLPDKAESFDFAVFGDRTGGVPAGIKVLEQAVAETNLISPDLVMTIGDLVQGYNGTEEWLTQMKEYRGTMGKLRMPWFPVAGNHDIYFRGDGKPQGEHEASYEKHFGPLWYWFAHKGSGFLVLFSDEGNLDTPDVRRSFKDPAQQKFSGPQLAWVRKSLEEMKDLKNVFVFMHQPRWDLDRYPGSNWAEVHGMLAAHGGVRACFAGHIHRLRHDGVKDGIQYHTLATTGGNSAGNYPDAGFLHHINLVSVRADGVSVSTIPVGSVMDPSIHTAERTNEISRARAIRPKAVTPFELDAAGKGSAAYPLEIPNPTKHPLEVTVTVRDSKGWTVTPASRTATIPPGGKGTVSFDVASDGAGFGGKYRVPGLTMDTYLLEGEKRTQLPPKVIPLEIRLGQLPDEAFIPAEETTAAHMRDRESGMKVESAGYDLPDGPFTLEARVYPEALLDSCGIVSKTQDSEYGLISRGNEVHFVVHLNGKYVRLKSGPVLKPGVWTDLAAVYDGSEARLYVDGKQVAAAPASGKRTRNKLPLYIGADTTADGLPGRSFQGSIDEVKLSKRALHTATYTPPERRDVDGDTVLLFHIDRMVAGRLPDRSASHAHAFPVGRPMLRVVKH